MADCRTFSTVGAIRLFVVRRVVSAAPAFFPRIRSTTRRAFCGETRRYLDSAFTLMLGSIGFSSGGLCRLRGLLRRSSGTRARRGLHRVAFELARRRKLAKLVPHHVLRDVHRNEFLAVVDRDRLSHKLGKNRRPPRPRADHLLLI